MTSADTTFRELSVRFGTLISQQAFTLHVVRARKDKVQSAGMRGGVQIAGAAIPGSSLTGPGGCGCASREPNPAKLHPKYEKLNLAGCVLVYLQVDDSPSFARRLFRAFFPNLSISTPPASAAR